MKNLKKMKWLVLALAGLTLAVSVRNSSSFPALTTQISMTT